MSSRRVKVTEILQRFSFFARVIASRSICNERRRIRLEKDTKTDAFSLVRSDFCTPLYVRVERRPSKCDVNEINRLDAAVIYVSHQHDTLQAVDLRVSQQHEHGWPRTARRTSTTIKNLRFVWSLTLTSDFLYFWTTEAGGKIFRDASDGASVATAI